MNLKQDTGQEFVQELKMAMIDIEVCSKNFIFLDRAGSSTNYKD